MFTVASADYAASVFLPALMRRVEAEAPSVEIVVRPLPAAFPEALEEERIDLALSPYPEPRATLVAQKLFEDRLVCVLRRGHPALRRASRRLGADTYASLSHVQIAPRGARGGVVDDWLARAGKTRHVALRVADFLVAPLVVAETDLVLTLPVRIARVFARLARAQRGGAAGGLPGVHDVADLAPAPQAGAGARLAARAAPRGGRGRERGARSETGEETTRAMTVARGARLGGVRPQRRMTGRLQRLEQPQRRAHNGTVIAHRRVPGACPFCLPTPRTGH